jgi:hypothetical protein
MKPYHIGLNPHAKQIFVLVLSLVVLICCVSGVYALTGKSNTKDYKQNYSSIGIVGDISTSTYIVHISNNKGSSDDNTSSVLSFDLSNAKKIESSNYTRLSLGDILAGDKIVVQGLKDNDSISISRVIDLSWDDSRVLVSIPADMLATSTVATSTDAIATSTSTASTTATTTEDSAVSNDSSVIPTFDLTASTEGQTASTTNSAASSTATSTASSTDQTATTTENISTSAATTSAATSTGQISSVGATTTPSVATTTEQIPASVATTTEPVVPPETTISATTTGSDGSTTD